MDAKSLASLRPRDESAAALRAALANVASERASAVQRQETAAANRLTAMTDLAATPKDIAAFEAHEREAALEIERLDLVAPDLRARLTAVEARERADAQHARVERDRRAYADAVQALEQGLAEYPQAAAAVARIVGLAHAQDAALKRFHTSVSATVPIGGQVHAHTYDPGIAGIGASFLSQVVLPGLPGAPMICGEQPKHPGHWHYFQNSPRGPYG